MESFEFSKAISSLCDFYERKEPKHGSVELWFEAVAKIPAEPISWIVKKIEKTHDNFPKNLPSSFWACYNEWLQTNPDKKSAKELFFCPDCDEGLLLVVKKSNRCKYVFRCARCRQDETKAYPFANRKDLLKEYDYR